MNKSFLFSLALAAGLFSVGAFAQNQSLQLEEGFDFKKCQQNSGNEEKAFRRFSRFDDSFRAVFAEFLKFFGFCRIPV